jgi:hypothetical protein
MVGLYLPISEKVYNIYQNIVIIGNFQLYNCRLLYFVKMLILVLISVFNFVYKLFMCYCVTCSWKSNSLTRKSLRSSFLQGGLNHV